MAVNDSEKKSRAILEKQTKKGEEYQGFQEAQGQLLNIQAEQRANLNEQRAISGMEMQQNQTLAQAAEIMAANNGKSSEGVLVPQPQQNPGGTQEVLNKFGIKKPGTSRTTKTQQINNTPQKVNITNNTTTHNNIQVNQPTPPSQKQIIAPIKTPGSDNTDKFKVWLSNAFAKQNEAAVIRDKEYSRREWALTRSANKMIRKMGDLGKAFAEKMNPKNINNIFSDQLKVVMFLLGFSAVAANIEKIMDFAAGISGSINRLVNWFTGGKKDGTFSDFFVRLFGGKEGQESGWDAITKLADTIGGRIKDGFNSLLESRGRAMKSVKFPSIDSFDSLDIKSVVSTVGTYLGDLWTAMISGTEGVRKNMLNSIRNTGKYNNLDKGRDGWNNYSFTDDGSKYVKNSNMGDAIMFDSKYKKNLKMAASDYNASGNLSNNLSSSVKQTMVLTNLMNETGSGAVNTTGFATGLESLKKAAIGYGKTTVSTDFLNTLGETLGISSTIDKIKKTSTERKVRYISVPKTEADWEAEGAGYTTSAAKGYGEGMMWNVLGSGSIFGAAGDAIVGGDLRAWDEYKKGNIFSGMYEGSVGRLASISNTTKAISNQFKAKLKRLGSGDNKIIMVDVNDPRYPESKYPTIKLPNSEEMVDSFLELTPSSISEIEKATKLSLKDDSFSFDLSEKMLRTLDSALKSRKTTLNRKNNNSHITVTSGLGELNQQLDTIKDLEMQDNFDKAINDEKHKGDRVSNMLNNAKEGVQAVTGVVSSAFNYITGSNFLNLNYSKSLSTDELQINSKYIMSRLINELGLTPTQAAGLVGNFVAESGLNPKAVNRDSGAAGIAQWLSKNRVENFKKIVGKNIVDSSLEEQVDFVIWELKNGYKNCITELKKVKDGDVEGAMKVGLGFYEFSGGFDKAISDFKRYGNQNPHLDRRYSGAVDSLNVYSNKDIVSNRKDLSASSKIYTDLDKRVTDESFLQKILKTDNLNKTIDKTKLNHDLFKDYLTKSEWDKLTKKQEWLDIKNIDDLTKTDVWGKVRDSKDYKSILSDTHKELTEPEKKEYMSRKYLYNTELTDEERGIYDYYSMVGFDKNIYSDDLKKIFGDKTKTRLSELEVSKLEKWLTARNAWDGKNGNSYKKDSYKFLWDLVKKSKKAGSKYLKFEDKNDVKKYWSNAEYVDYLSGSAWVSGAMRDNTANTILNYTNEDYNKGALDRVEKRHRDSIDSENSNNYKNWDKKTAAAKLIGSITGGTGLLTGGKEIDWSILNEIVEYGLKNKRSKVFRCLPPIIRMSMNAKQGKSDFNKILVLAKKMVEDLSYDDKIKLLHAYQEDMAGEELSEYESNLHTLARKGLSSSLINDEDILSNKGDLSWKEYFSDSEKGKGRIIGTLRKIGVKINEDQINDRNISVDKMVELMEKGANSELWKVLGVEKSDVFSATKEKIKSSLNTIKDSLEASGTTLSFSTKNHQGKDLTIKVDRLDTGTGGTSLGKVVEEINKNKDTWEITDLSKVQAEIVAAQIDVMKKTHDRIVDLGLILTGVFENTYITAGASTITSANTSIGQQEQTTIQQTD